MVKVIKTKRRVLESMPSFFKDRKSKKNSQQDAENQPSNNSVDQLQASLNRKQETAQMLLLVI
jgi:hypothetical protein